MDLTEQWRRSIDGDFIFTDRDDAMPWTTVVLLSGLLASKIVAANFVNDVGYPVIVDVMTFVIGGLFLRETKGVAAEQ
jgi:hypothetical protein